MSNENIVIKLKKPFQGSQEFISEITIRPVTGGDIMELDNPVDTTGMIGGKIGAYISRLADIPPSDVKKMSAVDFMACGNAILGFFWESDSQP